ncbi:hypothetical protein NDU88_005720 [Pleurodeles waltl]|uniref:Uncharacterized protein n=1 Tax=Pleurodeles waltl TaxID=8319 RepID=A0AAV7WVH2_PLEWA|nr:hypothetical protein NDU88_005720 [Pleurodeles waltl]
MCGAGVVAGGATRQTKGQAYYITETWRGRLPTADEEAVRVDGSCPLPCVRAVRQDAGRDQVKLHWKWQAVLFRQLLASQKPDNDA